MTERACTSCKYISQEKICPICESKTSPDWNGLIVILDPDDSRLAQDLNITTPGRYALEVRRS